LEFFCRGLAEAGHPFSVSTERPVYAGFRAVSSEGFGSG
jgi:hypothetical protein